MSSAPVEKWSIADVSTWLRKITLGSYAEIFAKHEINGEILLTMKEKDLTSPPLNISTFGAIRKFGIELENLKTQEKLNANFFQNDNLFSVAENSSDAAATVSEANFVETVTAEQVFRSNGYASAFVSFEEKKSYEGLPNGFQTTTGAPSPLEPEQMAAAVSSRAVMMPTILDRALEMEKSYPEFCWRYQTNVDLVKQLNTNDGIDAEVVIALSPVEFYVQPILVAEKAQKLLTSMNAFYTDDMEPIPSNKIFETTPCAVWYREEPGWYRAIVHEKGADDARVVFVDWGNSQFTKYADIKPLTTEFGRFPPLAVHCRIVGVRERSLEQKIIQCFLDEIESLQMLVKIVPTSFDDDVVSVRLLNRRTKMDIGEKYKPTDTLCQTDVDDEVEEKLTLNETSRGDKTAALPMSVYDRFDPQIVEQMRVKAEKLDKGLYASDMEAFFDGAPGFDEVDSDDEDFKPRSKKNKQLKKELLLKAQAQRDMFYTLAGVEYVRDYPKQAKPPKGAVTVFIAKVVSTREVYLRSDMQATCLNNMTTKLLPSLHEHGGAVSLPEHLIKSGTACAYKGDDGRWYRAKIGNTDDQDPEIPLILVDYARIVTVRRLDRAKIVALRAHTYLVNEFQIYKCRIRKLCDPPLTAVESELLNEMLIENDKFTAIFERDKEPYRVHLECAATMKEFSEMFEKEMADRDLEAKATRQRNSRLDIEVHRPNVFNQQKFDDVTAKYDRGKVLVGAVASPKLCSPTSSSVPKVCAVRKSMPSPPPNYSPSSRFLHPSSVPKRSIAAVVDDTDADDDPDVVEVIDTDDDD